MEDINISNGDAVKEIATLAIAGNAVKTGIPFAMVPRGYTVESLEKFNPDLTQVKQGVSVTSPSSLVAYIQRFKDERSVIFADIQSTKFSAVLDYHLNGISPAKSTHTVTYDCPLSDEWKAFTARDKKGMDQIAFAEFIEEYINCVASGADSNAVTGAQLLEMVLSFQETRTSEFKKVARLADGTFQMSYSDEKSGSGNTCLPEKISLAISPFHNGSPYQLDARFRYRLREGKLALWFELIEPRKIIEHAFNEILVDLQNQLPEIPVYEGGI